MAKQKSVMEERMNKLDKTKQPFKESVKVCYAINCILLLRLYTELREIRLTESSYVGIRVPTVMESQAKSLRNLWLRKVREKSWKIKKSIKSSGILNILPQFDFRI